MDAYRLAHSTATATAGARSPRSPWPSHATTRLACPKRVPRHAPGDAPLLASRAAPQEVLVRDVRGIGVMYAPAARSFTCVSPGARAEVAAYASLGELTALFRGRGRRQMARDQCTHA